jgi:hypothetical protein
MDALCSLTRRQFLEMLAALGVTGAALQTAYASVEASADLTPGSYRPGRIPNDYSRFLPGEEAALQRAPAVTFQTQGLLTAQLAGQSVTIQAGDQLDGWRLVGDFTIDGTRTAIFEKHVSHRGAIAYVTEHEGIVAFIPKQIGKLSNIRPRATETPHGVRFERAAQFEPGQTDRPGSYLLNSSEDPSYENVAALGAEYIGWTLVANEQAGPRGALYLDAAGRSRQGTAPGPVEEADPSQELRRLWTPDTAKPLFDPLQLFALSSYAPQIYEYVPGYSKRTLLGGYLPIANIGVWNPSHDAGYEVTVLLPAGEKAQPMARLRFLIPKDLVGATKAQYAEVTTGASAEPAPVWIEDEGDTYIEFYWNASAETFFATLADRWKYWHGLHENALQIDIPDEWLRNAAQAGLTLTRCSYRGLEPSYQVGEGVYTTFEIDPGCAQRPRCPPMDAIFPVSDYEFVWAHQLWNHVADADRYFQYYLDHYVLPNGELLYNIHQGEAPLNVGVMLANSARSYFYGRDLTALEKRLPILERMIGFVLERYEYSKRHFAAGDRRRGLIWGSPEADLTGDRKEDPDDRPSYYQNVAWIWRGLVQHSKVLAQAARDSGRHEFAEAAARFRGIAQEMRALVEASIAATRALGNPSMRAAGIAPFSPADTDRKVTDLDNYENHRFMEDWFLADWGDPQLDLGHLRHRDLSGRKVMGLGLSHGPAVTSNFMAHGTLSVLIRQEDYRPFLLTLYALACYTADSGSRYSPEDAFFPGGHPLEGDPNFWSAVVNSTLQPTLGLRWLLCYEETDHEVCHLQKAAPKHWFAQGQTIAVKNCPTRFGSISWSTYAVADRQWKITLNVPKGFAAQLIIHIHPNDGRPLHATSIGRLQGDKIIIAASEMAHGLSWHLVVS